MKSQIHEHQKSKLLGVSKKVLMLALLVLGTGAFANVKPVAAKTTTTKETLVRKHRKAVKKTKRVEATKPEATNAKK